jgi:poly(3-hydroxybutyrate) depolymerase
MYQRAMFCLAVLIGVMANAQTINVRGKISTQGGARPLPNATVMLVGQTLNGNSDTGGAYSIKRTTAVKVPLLVPQTENISFNNGTLEFYLSQQQSVKVEIFDIKGTLVKKDFIAAVPAGVFRYTVAVKQYATNVLVVRASIGANSLTCRYLSGNSANILQASSANVVATNGNLAKLAVVADSLRVTANGHTTKTVRISSYDTIVNIILDSVPGPSSGCGKLTSLASYQRGTLYSITSAGLSRRYIISIPANYDRNKPYRLVFAMHCMCGSMWSVNSENFYEYKKVADSTGVPAIFVAPSCYNGGNYNQSTWGCPVWDQGTKDHQFFDDMLKLFKDSLCVDTTRVFCAGFSYGAMFTNSLAQTHQRQLRAVVCYAASFGGGIYVPKNLQLPIAYMGTVGLSDTRCPPADGRACRDTMLKYDALNGVVTTEKPTEAVAGSLSHVVYDYKKVNPKYPVKWCTFDSDHQWSPVDGHGSGYYDANTTWTPYVAWPFLMQF